MAVGCEEGGATVVIVIIVVGIKLLAVVLGCVVLCTLPVSLAVVVMVMGTENENFVSMGDELAAVVVGCGVTTTVVLFVSTEVRDTVATILVVRLIARM